MSCNILKLREQVNFYAIYGALYPYMVSQVQYIMFN